MNSATGDVDVVTLTQTDAEGLRLNFAWKLPKQQELL